MARPQFGAQFVPGVKYLRHKNGVVHPFNPALENNPDFKVVVFSGENKIQIQPKPYNYFPEPREDVVKEEETEKREEIISPGDLKGSMQTDLLNPPMPSPVVSIKAPVVGSTFLGSLGAPSQE